MVPVLEYFFCFIYQIGIWMINLFALSVNLWRESTLVFYLFLFFYDLLLLIEVDLLLLVFVFIIELLIPRHISLIFRLLSCWNFSFQRRDRRIQLLYLLKPLWKLLVSLWFLWSLHSFHLWIKYIWILNQDYSFKRFLALIRNFNSMKLLNRIMARLISTICSWCSS